MNGWRIFARATNNNSGDGEMKRGEWLGLVAVVVAVTAVASSHRAVASAAQGWRVAWYVVNGALNAKGQSLSLGDGRQSVSLSNGWSCVVGSASKQLPLYEARTTICEKGSEVFQFVVQCEAARAKDHTQIGFLNRDHRSEDFIEVGCELK
jgi:hypothetical protein